MMKKRLVVGLLAGGLMAGMLPGVTSAVPAPDKDGPLFRVVISCEKEIGTGSVEITGPAGYAQHYAHKLINDSFLCFPDTKSMTMTKLP